MTAQTSNTQEYAAASPQVFDRHSAKRLFTDMFGSRRSSVARSSDESCRTSVASVGNKKDGEKKRVKLPISTMPPLRFVN